jgi:hypothetical protein
LFPAAASAQASIPLHVGASLDDGLTPVLYAIKAGIFKRNGLDVTLTASANGAALAAAVSVGGEIDAARLDHGVRARHPLQDRRRRRDVRGRRTDRRDRDPQGLADQIARRAQRKDASYPAKSPSARFGAKAASLRADRMRSMYQSAVGHVTPADSAKSNIAAK